MSNTIVVPLLFFSYCCYEAVGDTPEIQEISRNFFYPIYLISLISNFISTLMIQIL